MIDPERPPLHPFACEAIDQLLYKVDREHWPLITAMRVKIFYPLEEPVPPQAPRHLLSQIQWYADMLFKVEADQYAQFRDDGRYPAWLSRLGDRVIARVISALEKLEEADKNTLILGYHGLIKPDIVKHLQTVLREIIQQYEQGRAPGQRNDVAPSAPTVERPETSRASEPERESVAEQLKRLQIECRLTGQAMADELGIDLRSIFRHLAGKALPRKMHLAAYEKLFSERLGRNVILTS